MSFVDTIIASFKSRKDDAVLYRVSESQLLPTTGGEMLQKIACVLKRFGTFGIKAGDRVAIVGNNGPDWLACDLAALGYSAVSVPLYHRQTPEELSFMIRDCGASLVLVEDTTLAAALIPRCDSSVTIETFAELFRDMEAPSFQTRQGQSLATIIYTSGSSGAPKGVMLSYSNLEYMLERTLQRLDSVYGPHTPQERVFHFLPACFAGSRVMIYSQLLRETPLIFSTDLKNLREEMKVASPHYFLTVPAVLERIRAGIDEKVGKSAGLRTLKQMAPGVFSFLIRRKLGKSLRFVISGSAPLHSDTQLFFQDLGLPVYQVYGLTETTAIVSMDEKEDTLPGWTGRMIPGVEARLSDQGELCVRGPNIFPGYWNQPEETRKVFENGWFRTGDRAELDPSGRIRILGRLGNVIIPASGHNIVPEPIEDEILSRCPKLDHAVLVGHGRPYLSVVVTGKAGEHEVRGVIEEINRNLPHYRKIRKYYIYKDGFSVENGLMTANQKLKRKCIESALADPIETLYREDSASW